MVKVRAPEVSDALARRVAQAVAQLRQLDIAKRPGVAETIDWARALRQLGAEGLDAELVEETMGSVIKDKDDFEVVRRNMGQVLGVGDAHRY